MTEPAHAPVEASIDIDAAPPFAWHVLVSPDTVPLWLGALEYAPNSSPDFYIQTDAAKRAAGDVTGASRGRILEVVAPERFTFLWMMRNGRLLGVRLAVEAQDENGGEGARLSVEVRGFEQFAPEEAASLRAAHERQWADKTLPVLKAAAEHAASDPEGAGLAPRDGSA